MQSWTLLPYASGSVVLVTLRSTCCCRSVMSRASSRATAALLAAAAARAGVLAAVTTTYNFSGLLPYTALDFFELPFSVPAGTAELEVAHACTDTASTTNILDWGLRDEAGRVVGWGGGNGEPAVVGAAATSRSYLLAAGSGGGGLLAPGEWAVIVGKPRIATPPGHYSVNVTLRDAPTLPAQTQRRPYAQSPPLRGGPAYFAGDFHVHCRESGDAFDSASVDEVAGFARGAAGLDFVHLSDHNTVSASTFIADAQPRHPALLVLPGVEFTTYSGHAGALFLSEFVDFRVGRRGVSVTSQVAAIHAAGGLFSVNHADNYEDDGRGEEANSCVGCAWDYGLSLDAADVDAIEVGIQAWGGTGFIFSPRVIEWWDRLHALGHRHIAPIGGSDDHHGGANETVVGPWREGSPVGSPTTMVLAANLSHAALREGVLLGRTYVKMDGAADPDVTFSAALAGGGSVLPGGAAPPGATGVNLTVSLAASAAGARLGRAASRGGARRGGGSVRGVRGVIGVRGAAPTTYTLVLVRNNEATASVPVPGLPFDFALPVAAPLEGVDRWRAELHAGGNLAVLTNHLFMPAEGWADAPPRRR